MSAVFEILTAQGTFIVHHQYVWVQFNHGIHSIRDDLPHCPNHPDRNFGKGVPFGGECFCGCGAGIDVYCGALLVVVDPLPGSLAYVFEFSAIYIAATILCLHFANLCLL